MLLPKFVAYFELENNCPLLFLISYQSLFEASRCHLQTCFCPTAWQSRWHSVISLSHTKCINLKIWILGGPVWDSLTCPYNLIWNIDSNDFYQISSVSTMVTGPEFNFPRLVLNSGSCICYIDNSIAHWWITWSDSNRLWLFVLFGPFLISHR